mgnify:CR=1 FL=1
MSYQTNYGERIINNYIVRDKGQLASAIVGSGPRFAMRNLSDGSNMDNEGDVSDFDEFDNLEDIDFEIDDSEEETEYNRDDYNISIPIRTPSPEIDLVDFLENEEDNEPPSSILPTRSESSEFDFEGAIDDLDKSVDMASPIQGEEESDFDVEADYDLATARSPSPETETETETEESDFDADADYDKATIPARSISPSPSPPPRKRVSPSPSPSPSPPPKARKKRESITPQLPKTPSPRRSPSPPPKRRIKARSKWSRKKDSSMRNPVYGSLSNQPAPPRKSKGERERAVRSDKGKDHKWKDGRERTETYKKNEGVDWSRVRCKAETCWKTNTRKTDNKGSGAYKKNVEEDKYDGQLRRKGKRRNN